MDSLLSIVQMPAGVPVGTLAIGKAGRDQRGAAGGRDPGAARRGAGRARSTPGAPRQTEPSVADTSDDRRLTA